MNAINNMKLGTRLAFSFGILLVLVTSEIVIGLVSLQNNQAELKLTVEVDSVHIRLANIMADNARQTAISVRDYIIGNYTNESNEDLQLYLTTFAEKRAAYNDALDQLKGFVSQEAVENTSLLDAVIASADTARKNQDDLIALVKAGNVTDGINVMYTVAYPSVNKWIADIDSLIQSENEMSLSRFNNAEKTYNLTRIFMFVIGTVIVLLSLAIAFLLIMSISRPLSKITKAAEQIGGGDLTVDLPEEQRRDEIGVLSAAFRQMVATLRRSTSDISEAVGLLGSSASEILASTTQVASGTAETATSINETTTTVEEVRQAAQLSSKKAQSVSENAQQVAQVSQSGQKAVEDTSAGMGRIREQMETIAQTVVRLSEQSQLIGGIIASVTDLADQSNLLAVNAAIEAAKAGEQGKGFAVVAQEIKSLAEQSKQATAQVRGILSDVQKATSNAVMATEQGSKAVEAGVKQAAQAGEAIRALAETSNEAVQTAIQIVASSQQQVVGMDQIGVAMENINQAGSQNAASMKQMEVAAQNLHELGEKLKELVAQFKV
ncbi:MAG: HAMP domain-containing protein [Candidatus Atribacteria bacterium]|nr:HAMP domain-containing protein [Candidatus Atribacteria bacterium]